MSTHLKSDSEKSLMFDAIENGSGIKRECEIIRCKSYIIQLEARIVHLESIGATKDNIIESQNRLLRSNMIIE